MPDGTVAVGVLDTVLETMRRAVNIEFEICKTDIALRWERNNIEFILVHPVFQITFSLGFKGF